MWIDIHTDRQTYTREGPTSNLFSIFFFFFLSHWGEKGIEMNRAIDTHEQTDRGRHHRFEWGDGH